jgi:serine/threonine-protein kinase
VAAFCHRDLLVGALAVEIALLPRNDLLSTLDEWYRDRSRSLPEVLAQRLSLPEPLLARLESLAQAHLACLWDDPELSRRRAELCEPALASYSATPVSPPDPDARTVPRPPSASLPAAEADSCLARSAEGAGRYHRLVLHARGGLGEVYLARDEQLGRLVALKEIQPGRADDPTCRDRFLLEAEVTGNLEHPGIIPVYGLGAHADGRPYYAMRFVHGESLEEAIKRFHAAQNPPRNRSEAALTLRGLLRRFVDVCNAVEYAHSRGIVHRDLKPSNIMLGEFGETLIIDWGLAQRRARGQQSGARGQGPTDTPLAPDSCLLTPGGVGTPAFASPEQARGCEDQVGPHSDVYSLGVTLYRLLTGRTPFAHGDLKALLQKVVRGEYLPPSQVKPGVPRALEAVCRKAMAVRPEDRYASARALAEDVERWLADEPVRAHREPLATRLRRWGRRHRTVVTAGVILLLVSVLGLALGLAAVEVQKAETERQRDRAVQAEEQARAHLLRAQSNLKLATRAVDECFGVAKSDPLLQQAHMSKVRKLLLEKTLPFYRDFRALGPDDPALAFEQADCLFRVAYITVEIGSKHDALAHYRQVLDILGPVARANPTVTKYAFLLAHTWNNVAILQRDAGNWTEALHGYTQARDIQLALVKAHPQDMGHRRDLAVTWSNLGYLNQEMGKHGEALQSYTRARDIQVELVKAQPTVCFYRADLAITLSNLALLQQKEGKYQDAMSSNARARELLLVLVKEQPGVAMYQDVLSRTWNNLGILQTKIGQPKEALQSYAQARDLKEGLIRAHPEVGHFRGELAGIWVNLGQLQTGIGQYAPALESLNRALGLLSEVRRREPPNPTYLLFQRNALLSRAHLLERMGRYHQAVSDWDAVVRLETAAKMPDTARLRRAGARARAGDYRTAVAEAQALARGPVRAAHELYELACVHALSAAALHRDATQPLPRREKTAATWAGEALDLLRRAERAGLFEHAQMAENLKKDRDLDFLRSRSDFKQWLESLPPPRRG